MRLALCSLLVFIFLLLTSLNPASAGLSGCDDLSHIDETPMVDFTTEIQPIFDDNCIQCHGPPDPIAFMDLTLGHQDLINVPSFQFTEINRIEPGDASFSYLFLKINCSSQLSGDRMPRDAPPLSLQDQALIRDWINQILIYKNGFE
ncbi:hypothetical protein [Marinicella rhabdoformis]|uniref:hypothetical protein n=1 Tax=Marinicella rhabdoformis TaxID=2580566 RepID=UPI0012AED85D|nr:hypothetical protein [Marinicella rhabdoformis]